MARRSRIILHGKQSANQELRDAVAVLREEGHEIEVRVTWEAGDSQRLTREAAEEGVDTVVAGGGDGTINEVATGLATITVVRKTTPEPPPGAAATASPMSLSAAP